MSARLEHNANVDSVIHETDCKWYYGDAHDDICDNNILDAVWKESHIANILQGDSRECEGDAHRTASNGTHCEETQ